jgi:hypothetical protein
VCRPRRRAWCGQVREGRMQQARSDREFVRYDVKPSRPSSQTPPTRGNPTTPKTGTPRTTTKSPSAKNPSTTSRPSVESAPTSTSRPTGPELLRPGPHAREFVTTRNRTASTQDKNAVQPIGKEWGCHHCGTKNPGTPNGRFIFDHNPATALSPPGTIWRGYPHCQLCSNWQSIAVRHEQMRTGKYYD